MPGRNYVNSLNFPFAYQGQEKDAETNLINFELRQYDARLGRWYNPDPMGQHHSPYLAMSNNPVSSIDPNGGYDVNGGVNIDPTHGSDDPNFNGPPPLQDNTWVYTNPADRRAIQSALGTSYEAQQKNRILDNASLGKGYRMKDGGYFSTQGGSIYTSYYTDHSYLLSTTHNMDGSTTSTYENWTTCKVTNYGSYSENEKMPSWFDGMVSALRKLDNRVYHGSENYTQRPPIKTWFWGQVPYGPDGNSNVHMTSVNATNTTNQNPGSLMLSYGKTPMKFTYGGNVLEYYEELAKAGDHIGAFQYFFDGIGWDPVNKGVFVPNRDTVIKQPGVGDDTLYLTYPTREYRATKGAMEATGIKLGTTIIK